MVIALTTTHQLTVVVIAGPSVGDMVKSVSVYTLYIFAQF